MAITPYSHNLTVISFGRRNSDGKVLIRFAITTPGIYYSMRFACRAYPPANENGFVMTPAIGDIDHTPDPIFVEVGKVYTWVWDAPADGYPSVNLTGWSIFLGYANLFCCDLEDQVERLPDETLVSAAATAPATPPATPPSGSGQTLTNAALTPPTPTTPPATPAPAPVVTTGFFGYNSKWNPKTPVAVVPTPAPAPAPTVAPTTTAPAPTTNTPSAGPAVNTTDPLFFGGGTGTIPVEPITSAFYTREYTDIFIELQVAFSPNDKIPQDAKPLLFAFAKFKFGYQAGLRLYVEAMDRNNVRYKFPEPETFEEVPYETTPRVIGRSMCLHLSQLAVGPVKLFVAVLGTTGSVITAVVKDLEITPPGTSLLPADLPSIFPPSVLNATGLPGNSTSIFEGSYSSVGDEDWFIFTAVDNTAIVVKTTREAEETGFDPVLKIYSITDPYTSLVTHDGRISGISDNDKFSHRIGWVDDGELTTGSVYMARVVHRYPNYSRKWAFQVYTNATPKPTEASLTIDGQGKLDGTISCAYGRQSLKLINTRTKDVIFVATNPDGNVASIRSATRPTTDSMSVSRGDLIRIIRPGMAQLYRSGDLILEENV